MAATETVIKGIDTIKARIRTQSTKTIVQCIYEIGGGNITEDQRLVRACLLDVYEEREGEDALDLILDDLGL